MSSRTFATLIAAAACLTGLSILPAHAQTTTNAAALAGPFGASSMGSASTNTPNMADFMAKVMETSKRIEEIKKQMDDRKAQLFATNPEIKAMRDQMVAMQKQITEILAADPEMQALKMNRDVLWTVMPQLPAATPQAGKRMFPGP